MSIFSSKSISGRNHTDTMTALLLLGIVLAELTAFSTAYSTTSVRKHGRALKRSSSSLYEYQLALSTATPFASSHEDCLEEEFLTPGLANFSWFGLRIQLPDDAEPGNAAWTTSISNVDPTLGYQQPYGQVNTTTIYNQTFVTSQSNPIIRYNMNSDILWTTQHFDFENDLAEEEMIARNNAKVVVHTKSYGISCIIEQGEGFASYSGGLLPVLELSMTQRLYQEGSDNDDQEPSSSSSSLWESSSPYVVATTLFSVCTLYAV